MKITASTKKMIILAHHSVIQWDKIYQHSPFQAITVGSDNTPPFLHCHIAHCVSPLRSTLKTRYLKFIFTCLLMHYSRRSSNMKVRVPYFSAFTNPLTTLNLQTIPIHIRSKNGCVNNTSLCLFSCL